MVFFELLRYDNLKSAVKRILRGYRREETSRFIAFRSHWRFQSEFCNPARGNEKGGVEGEGGYFRRNHWVPLPEARDLEELNAYLERCCREDQRRILSGRTETVGAAMLHEQPHLLPLAAESFDLAESQLSNGGWAALRTRANQPLLCSAAARHEVEARVTPILSSCGMKVGVSLAMNAATAASSRYSIWSTILTYCEEARRTGRLDCHWRSGARRDAGPSRSIGCGMR